MIKRKKPPHGLSCQSRLSNWTILTLGIALGIGSVKAPRNALRIKKRELVCSIIALANGLPLSNVLLQVETRNRDL
jgi:hypothetical protein